jgi:hypothetical protein
MEKMPWAGKPGALAKPMQAAGMMIIAYRVACIEQATRLLFDIWILLL